MMNKSKTKKAGLIKYSLILPAALMLVLTSSLFSACNGENRVNESAAELRAMEKAEIMPEFPGGKTAMRRWLAQNVRFPAKAVENGIQGRVVVQFVVQATGEIADVEVVRGVDPLLDREAIRVVEAMPNWTPGEHEGQKVNVKFTLPVNFKIDVDGTPQMFTLPDNEVIVVGFASPQQAQGEVYNVVETPAQFPGGKQALRQWLAQNVRFPAEAAENGIQGRVTVMFTVNTDGSIQDVEVVRGVDPLLDAEAVRAVQQMPNWIPAQQRGRNVRHRFALPIIFELQ